MKTNFSQEGLDLAINEIKRRHKKNYGHLTKKIILQIKKFRQKNNPDGKILIGISGGIDSTVTAALARDAVGKKNLILAYLPAIEKDEGIKYYPIVEKFINPEESYTALINKPTDDIVKIVEKIIKQKIDNITKGNIAARIRVNFFYAIAREKNAIVLGTTNRSEFLQGYATKYGTPMSCDFGVLDELYKTDIMEIASALKVPTTIIHRTPSTGFFIGQTHAKELEASIEEQDAAAYLLYEKKLSFMEIFKKYGASKKYLLSFVRRFNNNLHKRMLQPEHVKLGYIKND